MDCTIQTQTLMLISEPTLLLSSTFLLFNITWFGWIFNRFSRMPNMEPYYTTFVCIVMLSHLRCDLWIHFTFKYFFISIYCLRREPDTQTLAWTPRPKRNMIKYTFNDILSVVYWEKLWDEKKKKNRKVAGIYFKL